MQKPSIMKKILPLILFTVTFPALYSITAAQSLYKVSEEEKVQNSSLIVEGKVVDQQSFWNPRHTMIFTSNKVEVYKVFKGALTSEFIEVLTQGGTVGDISIIASDLLELYKADVGVFFCHTNSINLRSPSTNKVLYDIWSSAQGCYKYDVHTQKANAPFVRYASITNELYPELQAKTGRVYEDKKPSFKVADLAPQLQPQARVAAVSITSFTPSVVAGAMSDAAQNVLTINGSGFGTASGAAGINFDNPDDGTGGTPLFIAATNTDYIITWTATQITLRTPAKVGTGFFTVFDDLGASSASPSALDIKYAILTLGPFGAPFSQRMVTLADRNGTGGFTYLYSNAAAGGAVDFSTAAQEPPFSRAITTWREVRGLNFGFGGTTANQVVNPGETVNNTIMLDNTNTTVPVLASGVLAVCYTSGNGCGGSFNSPRLGFDIVVRNAGVSTGTTNFNNGPCRTATGITEIDMESVMLHELGHAINLGHINDSYQGVSLPNINPGKLMNFAIVNGVDRRSPDWSANTGAQYCITPKSFTYPCLGIGEMTPLTITNESKDNCPLTFPSTPTPSNTSVTFDLNHATSDKNVDPQFTAVNTSGTGTAVTNNAYYAIRTTPAGGTLSIIVSVYSTTPAAQAACTGAGVELSLYQVSSCPAGQSFPAPVAYRTFNGNGALTNITGLAGSTSYLLAVDGLSNSRANFSLLLNGTSLPISFLSFTGHKNNNTVVLDWQTASEFDNKHFQIETSKDGTNFYPIGIINSKGNSTTTQSYTFTDPLPLKGPDYYRLKQVDMNGQYTYSNTVLINFTDKGRAVVVYPNPARDQLTVDLNRPSQDVKIRFLTTDGKVIRTENIGTVQRSKDLDISTLSSGAYILEIITGNSEKYFVRFIKK
jgi:Secretion system C-terminal sorting domain